jgi:hypothetical protein
MASKNKDLDTATSAQLLAKARDKAAARQSPVDDYLGEYTVANVPRIAIGDGTSGACPEVPEICGEYVCTTYETFADKRTGEIRRRLLHHIRPRELIEGAEEVIVYGCFALDSSLPRLPPDTRIRAKLLGKVKLQSGNQMKRIEVKWPKGTLESDNPWLDSERNEIGPGATEHKSTNSEV